MRFPEDDFFKKRNTVAILASVCVILWGSAASFIKLGYAAMEIDQGHVPSILLFAGCRFAITGVLIILIFSVIGGKLLRPRRIRECGRIVVLSLFETVMQYVPYYVGLTHTSGTTAAIIHGCNAFTMILAAVLLFRSEKMTVRKALGCALGISAVVLMNYAGLRRGIRMSLAGEGLLLLAQMGYVISMNLTKYYARDSDPILLTGWQFILGSTVMAATGYALGGRFTLASGRAVAVFIYLSLLGAISYSLWSMLLKNNDVSRIAVFNFIVPVCGILFSALLLGETSQAFNGTTLFALALICLGIRIVNGAAAGNAAESPDVAQSPGTAP